MTYGVPYSFGPGTKARADEVNANFIEVLNKIEEANSRIEDVNTQSNVNKTALEAKIDEKYDELKSSKVSLDLSNLNSAGKTVLNNKANSADIDGKWVSKNLNLLNGAGPVGGNIKTFSLSSYLPDDGKIYDVIFRIDLDTLSSGTYGLYALASDLINNWFSVGRVDYSKAHYSASTVRVPISSTRKLYLKSNSSTKGSINVFVSAIGYRKVR